jgi:hypothetical protein
MAFGTFRVPLQTETVVQHATSLQPLAWLPEALAHLCTHPFGRIWAGGVGNYLCLFTLEGGG